MLIANAQNLHQPLASERPYGIRVTLRRQDPFTLLLGQDWNKCHWFGTARERDEALADMRRKHEYSRPGDQPAIDFAPIDPKSG
jgi:hypothetical protein